MLRPISLGLRAVQFLMAVVVLSLAAVMIKNQVYESAPVTTRYSTFTGGFGMIVGGVGILGAFASFIPELVPIALDALAGLLFLAGGIAWAVGLKDTENCSNYGNMLLNGLLNQGTISYGGQVNYGVVGDDTDPQSILNRLKGNCQRAQADEVLQFVCFAFAVGLVALGYLQMRRGTSRGGAGAYVA